MYHLTNSHENIFNIGKINKKNLMHRKIPIGIDFYLYREGLKKISKIFDKPPLELAMHYWLRQNINRLLIL